MIVAIASCCHRRKLSSASLNEIGIENFVGENTGEESKEEAGEVTVLPWKQEKKLQKPWIEKKERL